MNILGVSCFYHESAACLLHNGTLVAASAEERFSRIKHDSDVPRRAIDFCLKQGHISSKDVDLVVFYEKPFWKFQRIFQSVLSAYPNTSQLFAKAITNLLSDKLWVKSILAEALNIESNKILFVPHHLSHAASAFYPSGFDRAAILTVDGVGEWTTTSLGHGEGLRVHIDKEIRFPHSLGLLYSAFTAFLGFEVNDGEYKVMGMAPYGKPKYVAKVRRLAEVYPDASFRLNMNYFAYQSSTDTSYSREFLKLFGSPRPRDLHFFTKRSGYPSYFGAKKTTYEAECRANQYYADVAASIQAFTEERVLHLAHQLHESTKLDNLCIAGGVGLNSVANGMLLRSSPFKRIFVQPAAGDDGGALGAALYAYHMMRGGTRRFVQSHCYFGYESSQKEIETTLSHEKIPYRKIASEKALTRRLVNELIEDKVIGFYHGRAEWGPRALGARSIIASPRSKAMKDLINVKVKFREPYRPFAPVTTAQKASRYFELGKKDHQYLTNYMLGVFPVKRSMRSKIPAITHIDGSARPQIIKRNQNSLYYDIVNEFGKRTGIYVLLNTSFNLKGEPIVNTAADAVRTFRNSGLDLLVLGQCIIYKRDIPI